MDPTLFALVAAFAGIGLGVAIGWWFMQARVAAAQVAGAQASSQELATARAQLQLHEQERLRRDGEHQALRSELAGLRDEASGLGARLAQSEERASQVPVLQKKVEALEAELRGLQASASTLRAQAETLAAQLEAERAAHAESRKLRDGEAQRRQQLEGELGEAHTALAEAQTQLRAERTQAQEKLQLLEQAKEGLTNQFKVLADEILEQKSARFTEQNKQNLDQLLEPLKTQIEQFKGKVEEVYVNESKDRSALKEQVQHLLGMNQRLSQDANNLTAALKGSNKAQGNWGELVLERILESAGLRKGSEFDVQESHTQADGTRLQPDVVIHLPEDKHLVVDSKVTLTAYQAASLAETDELREAALAEHLESVRGHIKGLSAKNYQQLHGLRSLDFVVMFVPVEPAYMLALQADPGLWQEAWQRNVLLVSPSTLLFVVRTVAHLWRQEQQNRNALEIAKRGAALYDKLQGFVADLLDVGTKLDRAQDAYQQARRKLSEGNGNVIRQAEMLRELGVKPTKQLPSDLVQVALEEPVQLQIAAGGKPA